MWQANESTNKVRSGRGHQFVADELANSSILTTDSEPIIVSSLYQPNPCLGVYSPVKLSLLPAASRRTDGKRAIEEAGGQLCCWLW